MTIQTTTHATQQQTTAFIHWARHLDGFHKKSVKQDELFYLNEAFLGGLNIKTGTYWLENTESVQPLYQHFLEQSS